MAGEQVGRVTAFDGAEELGALVEQGVSAVLRYFRPPRSASVRSGCAGGGHFLGGDSAAAEMVDQSGPAG